MFRKHIRIQNTLYLKSKDVKDSQGSVFVSLCSTDDIVDPLYQPGK